MFGCPCTGGQKPQEENDGKEERGDKRGNKEMRGKKICEKENRRGARGEKRS